MQSTRLSYYRIIFIPTPRSLKTQFLYRCLKTRTWGVTLKTYDHDGSEDGICSRSTVFLAAHHFESLWITTESRFTTTHVTCALSPNNHISNTLELEHLLIQIASSSHLQCSCVYAHICIYCPSADRIDPSKSSSGTPNFSFHRPSEEKSPNCLSTAKVVPWIRGITLE